MNKTQRKFELIKTITHCTKCGCKLKISEKISNCNTNEAILKNGTLICYQCHRIECKRKEIENLPFLKRWKKKIDIITGIFTVFRKFRAFVNQIYYFKIKKGKPTSRMPYWLTTIDK